MKAELINRETELPTVPVQELLTHVLTMDASDLHLTVGAKPTVRIHGDLKPLEQYDILERVPDGRASSNPERDLMRRELGNRINNALGRLTPRERMVFELKHYHGLRLRTVGEILNTTEETAKNTLFRATQKLRGALADMR